MSHLLGAICPDRATRGIADRGEPPRPRSELHFVDLIIGIAIKVRIEDIHSGVDIAEEDPTRPDRDIAEL
jgi:hypothetical protein